MPIADYSKTKLTHASIVDKVHVMMVANILVETGGFLTYL